MIVVTLSTYGLGPFKKETTLLLGYKQIFSLEWDQLCSPRISPFPEVCPEPGHNRVVHVPGESPAEAFPGCTSASGDALGA